MPPKYLLQLTRDKILLAVSVCIPLVLWAGLLLLWPGVNGPFIFDDFPYFDHLNKLGGHVTWSSLGEYLASYPGPMGRSLSMASFVLNDHDWPSTPDSFKRTNLFIHLLNGVLVFGLSRSIALLTNSPRQAAVIAIATMAVWLLHPIQVSAVFLTVQRITMLSGLWVFAALWVYTALLRGAHNLRGTFTALAGLGVLTAIGVLFKENAALTFLFAAVLNITVFSEKVNALPKTAKHLLHVGTLGPIVMAIVLVVINWESYGAYVIRDFTPLERLMTEGRVLTDYLSRILLPAPGGSGLFNDDYVISRGWTAPITTLFSWTLIGLLILSALLWRQKWPLAALSVLWFFSGHLLESTVLDLELYFEHRNYVPSFGFALALSSLLVQTKSRLRYVYRAAAIAWFSLMVVNTGHQARIWGNEALLAFVWGAEHPNSVRANQKLADSYFRMGRPDKARKALAEPLARGIAPAVFSSQLVLLDCANTGRVSPALIAETERALTTDKPSYATGPTLRDIRIRVTGGACQSSVNWNTWFALTNAALANPRRASYESYVRVERGYAYLSMSRVDDALNEFGQAFALRPEPDLAFLVHAVLMREKRYDEAKVWLDRARSAPLSTWRALFTQRDRKAEKLECHLLQLRGQPVNQGQCRPEGKPWPVHEQVR